MKHLIASALVICVAMMTPAQKLIEPYNTYEPYELLETVETSDSFGIPYILDIDWFKQQHPRTDQSLTQADYDEMAAELGVDPPTIHAVIDVEAGSSHEGFWKPGKPIISFSPSLFRSYAKKNGTDISKYVKTHPAAFSGLNTAKYGSQQAAQQARLEAAMAIDPKAAIESTFWGMFQIGGFNWKRCGASSPQEFMELMQRSERDQLELFVNFLQTTGLDKALQQHDWHKFARGYNGPAYAARGYHTKLANAYKKYS